MQLPALIQVGDDKWINPNNICSFTDYGKRIEIGMMGSTTIMVKDGWLLSLRKAILAQIPGHDYTTTTGTEEDVELTELLPDGICVFFKACNNVSKREDLCQSKDGVSVPDNCDRNETLCIKYERCTSKEKGHMCIIPNTSGGYGCYTKPNTDDGLALIDEAIKETIALDVKPEGEAEIEERRADDFSMDKSWSIKPE